MSLRPRIAVVLIAASSLVVGLGSCSDDEPTPEEARYQRVEETFVAAFGEEDAACMLDQFDDDMIAALDTRGELPQGAALDEFTAIAQACVLGEDVTIPDAASSSTAVPDESAPAGDPEATPDPEDGGEADTGADTTPAPTDPEPTEPTDAPSAG